MWGRKAKRIAELEAQVIDLRDNLAVAVVKAGPVLSQRIEVRKDTWYRVGYAFRHTGSDALDVTDLLVINDQILNGPYFDGEVP